MRPQHRVILLVIALVALLVGWWVFGAEGPKPRNVVPAASIASDRALDKDLANPDVGVGRLTGDPSAKSRLAREEAGDAGSHHEARDAQASPGERGVEGYTLRFAVTNASGNALGECPIWVLALEGSESALATEMATDSEGMAEIALVAGRYMFGVNVGQEGPTGVAALPGLSMEIGELELAGDELRRVTLQRMSAAVHALVSDDLGAPVPGALVIAVGGQERRVTTDGDGSARLDELVPGEISVRVEGDAAFGLAFPKVSGQTVIAGENRTAEARFKLARLGNVLVSLEADGAPAAVGADPVLSITVDLDPVESSYRTRPARTAVSMAESVLMEGLAPGTYRARASFPSGSAWTLASEFSPLQVWPGETASLVVRAAAVSTGVEGVVVTRSGDPAARLPLAVFPLDAGGIPVHTKGKVTRTGSDGRFSIVGLVPGSYGVTMQVQLVKDENFAWPDTSVRPFETFAVPCPGLRLTVDPGATIVGTVLGTAADGPVRLELDRYRFDSAQSFDVEGGQVVIRHLRAGRYRLRWLNRAGEAMHEESIVLAEGGERAVTLDLR